MNANELADLLEVDSWYKLVTREEIANMLRQFGLAESIIKQQELEIKALKRPNNVVGVPCDELKKMQDRLAHLEKMVVWYQDITMTGINSTDYENGFWDAVDFVKSHQVKDKN